MLWVEHIHSAALEWDNGVWLRERVYSHPESAQGKHQCGEVAWTDDLNRGPFLSDHGSQELELKEKKKSFLLVCLFLKNKTKQNTFLAEVEIRVLSVGLLGTSFMSSCHVGVLHDCFLLTGAISVFWISHGSQFIFWTQCVNEGRGSRKHVKRTIQSPVEGCLVSVARWVQALISA